MNKNLFTIAIALIILALVAAPVAGVLPSKSPLPSGSPFNVIWTLFQNLQNQIIQIQSAPEPLKVITGRFSGYETIVEVPAGFTKAQCTCNAAVDHAPPIEGLYMQGFNVVVYPSSTNGWGITSHGAYMGSSDPTGWFPLEGWYIVVCQR